MAADTRSSEGVSLIHPKIQVQSQKTTVLRAKEELGEAPQLAQGPGVPYKWLERP